MITAFISYRRETAAGEARALFNDLVAKLGEGAVFMDVDSIALGRDFRTVLQKTLDSCDLMLVVIDKEWAEAKDEAGRTRLENPNDFVRMEVEAGLKRDIVVAPILVRGARMPIADQLPTEIRDLAYRNGFELSHNRWSSDILEMIRRLKLDDRQESGPIGSDILPIEKVERPSVPSASATSKRSFILVALLAVSLALIGVLGVQQLRDLGSRPQGSAESEQLRIDQPERSSQASGWKSYLDEDVSLRFDYPQDWQVKQRYFYKTAGGSVAAKPTVVLGPILSNSESENTIWINMRQAMCMSNEVLDDVRKITGFMPTADQVGCAEAEVNDYGFILHFDEVELLETFKQMLASVESD